MNYQMIIQFLGGADIFEGIEFYKLKNDDINNLKKEEKGIL